MRKNPNDLAFPRPASEYTVSGTLPEGNEAIDPQDGLTKREWFAGMALQGLLSRNTIGSADCVDLAYEAADRMIAASQRPPKKEGA